MPTIKGLLKLVSEYDLEIPQSQTADNPMAPRGRATQASATRDRTITESRFVMNLGEDYLGPVFEIINDQSLRLFVKMHSMVVCDKKNSERSCDPADEFIIFIAKASSEGLSLRTCTYLCVQFQ